MVCGGAGTATAGGGADGGEKANAGGAKCWAGGGAGMGDATGIDGGVHADWAAGAGAVGGTGTPLPL